MRERKEVKEYLKLDSKDAVVMDFLMEELETMTTSLVVKLEHRARKYETVESKKMGDQYVECVDKIDVFESYLSYSAEVINKAGLGVGTVLSDGTVVTEELFKKFCVRPIVSIPNGYKQSVLDAQREYVISTYIEKNAYYRELHGLPPIDENPKNFVYLKKPIKGVDITKPIHLMTEDELIKLKVAGILDSLILANKDKKYLKHLLDVKIDYHIARKASNFSILYISRPTHHEGLSDRFIALYSESVSYVMGVLYDKAYTLDDEYYDGFIGMFILTIAIQRFITNYFKSGIKREFFNKDVIKTYMDSYGIPFYSDISLTYLTRISKNLNMLLLFKATDQIFVDIFSLFGLKDSSIYKYFLLKQRKLDGNNEPVFAFKNVTDPEGNVVEVEDLDAMWDLKFVNVPTDTKQLSVEMLDSANYIDYNLVVDDDYLWGGDGDREDFLNRILESEFNYVETKYISMTSKYELSKLGFEICYFFKMVYDLKPKEDNLIVNLHTGQHKLFDVFTTLFALASIKLNFDGNIMDTNTKVLHVMGFNFERDKQYIENIIKDANLKDDPDIRLKDAPKTFFKSAELLNLYFSNRTVYRNLLARKQKAKTIKEYNAYKRIYDASMITTYNNEFYKLKDGSTAKTYIDYLEENDAKLYKFVKETDSDTLIENLDMILVGLDNYFKSDKFDNIFLNIPTLSLDATKRFIYYLVDIFKSYTVDLISMNVMYHMGDKYTEYVKILDEDEVEGNFDREQTIHFKDKNIYEIPFKFYADEYLPFKDKIHSMSYNITLKDYLYMKDKHLVETIVNLGNSEINDNRVDNLEKFDFNDVNKEHHNRIKIKDYLFIERSE